MSVSYVEHVAALLRGGGVELRVRTIEGNWIVAPRELHESLVWGWRDAELSVDASDGLVWERRYGTWRLAGPAGEVAS